MDDCRTAHLPNPDPFVVAVHDAVRALAGRVPLLAPGSRTANYSNQPDAHWPCSRTHFFPDAAPRRNPLSDVGSPATRGTHFCHAGSGNGIHTRAEVHA